MRISGSAVKPLSASLVFFIRRRWWFAQRFCCGQPQRGIFSCGWDWRHRKLRFKRLRSNMDAFLTIIRVG